MTRIERLATSMAFISSISGDDSTRRRCCGSCQLEVNLFASRFDGKGEHLAFVNGMLSRNSNAVIQHHMRRLEEEFTELHNQDVGLSLEDRFGTSLFIAMRPWAPDLFKKLQRKPIQKQF